jgi:hypothetical protein
MIWEKWIKRFQKGIEKTNGTESPEILHWE